MTKHSAQIEKLNKKVAQLEQQVEDKVELIAEQRGEYEDRIGSLKHALDRAEKAERRAMETLQQIWEVIGKARAVTVNMYGYKEKPQIADYERLRDDVLLLKFERDKAVERATELENKLWHIVCVFIKDPELEQTTIDQVADFVDRLKNRPFNRFE